MKTIDYAFVRLIQFLVLLFFTFTVLVWYGVALLIPLTLWFNLTNFFSAIFWPVVAMILALLVIGSLSLYLSKIPKLLETLLAMGMDIVKLGYNSVKRMSEIASAVHNDAAPPAPKTDTPLKDNM